MAPRSAWRQLHGTWRPLKLNYEQLKRPPWDAWMAALEYNFDSALPACLDPP